MFSRTILQHLKAWMDDPLRKPLMLRGARQVGKSSAVRIFGQSFKHFAEVNLEKAKHRELLERARDNTEILSAIELLTGVPIVDHDTLIFIDEIQQVPSLITQLRFFLEERRHLPVIAAGSHLEAKIAREGLSVPVGRVDNAFIYPLTFREHLEVFAEDALLRMLDSASLASPPSEVVHHAALDAFSQFMCWGGMPEIAAARRDHASTDRVATIYESLMSGFREDVFKYASEAEAKYLSFVIDNAPQEIGKAFKYENFGGGGFKSREMHRAFDVLEQVMLLHQVEPTHSLHLPMSGQPRHAKKLLFLDIGLVSYTAQLAESYLVRENLSDIFRGAAADQAVGQELLAIFPTRRLPLFYWCRHTNAGSAELDFTISHHGRIVGIEVKSSTAGRLRSLHQFIKEVPDSIAVRIHTGPLAIENLRVGAHSQALLSVPLYLVYRLPELLDDAIDHGL